MFALQNKIGKSYVVTSTIISGIFILLIICTLLVNSTQAVFQAKWQLFSTEWHPPASKFGILPMLYGSGIVTIIALIIATPLGFLAAVFTSEILPKRYRFYVKFMLELLAGIPSIVYGLIGIAFFCIWVSNIFDIQSGRTLLTAGVLLAIMILPTIITLTDDALDNVPQKYREAAGSLGLYSHEVILKAVLPIAASDILGAILLALGRALGETMAIMLVIGSIDKIPHSVLDILVAGQTVTSKLGRELSEAAFGSLHFSAMIFMGFFLLIINLLLTTVAQHFFKPKQRLYE